MKKSKILACVSALFAMVLVGCNNTSKSSDNPSVTPSSETTSQAPTSSSVGGNSSSTPAPSSSKTESSSKTPTPSSSSSVHVCEHVCPQCGKCQDETCKDPACADKCSGHGVKPIETVDVVYGADGTFTLEAENSQITGVNTTTEPGEGFVLDRASDNPDHQTSNGGCV
ncbi:MAG: hypothetical protein MJ236_07310, partial [Clostridia bacterium]|nr:hypothetical protein [Clostridia bacterium]